MTLVSSETINPFLPPEAPDRPIDKDLRFSTVRITAWAYVVYFLLFVPVQLANASPDLPLSARVMEWVMCALLAGCAFSATRESRLGYYFCYVFSVLILLTPPIGTVLGGNMLLALRRNRFRFFRRYPAP